jgi:hypothetical protein
MPSINQACNALPGNQTGVELQKLMSAFLADLTALRTSFNTLVAKLNADAGVTDTNYAAAAALTVTA